MQINVIKRNGNTQPFDLIKIKKMIDFACEHTSCNPIVLESKIHLSLKNNIKTSEIQELLILESIKLISEDEPDWVYVAGKLATKLLHSEIYKNTKIEYNEYPKYLKYATSHKFYRNDIMNYYSIKDIEIISKLIDKNKDYKFSISQVLALKDKYLLKNHKGFIEYPQFSDLTSSLILAFIEKEEDRLKWAKEFFYLIKEEKNSLATPFKANLRLTKGNTGSCFILGSDDSLAQLMKSWIDIGGISKAGGGIGYYMGMIRPGLSYTPKVVKANKITKWTKIINDIALAVNQRGIRPGAITPAVDWWHLDIEDFIEMKAETNGDLRDKCFDLFPQVVVDEYFIDNILVDNDVYLFNHFELKEKFDIDIISKIDQELYDCHIKVKELIESGQLKEYKKISAKYLWKEFLRIWFETGDFYISSKEGINLSNYLKDYGLAHCANLCVDENTLLNIKIDNIHSETQIIKIKDLINLLKNHKVYTLSKNLDKNIEEYNLITECLFTNPESKDNYEIEDEKTGYKIICTGDHKIFTKNRGYVMAKHLLSTDILDISNNELLQNI